jgi:hypothetical protein
LDYDTDGDTILDGDEYLKGLHPINPDTDYDGMSDGIDAMPRYKFESEAANWKTEYPIGTIRYNLDFDVWNMGTEGQYNNPETNVVATAIEKTFWGYNDVTVECDISHGGTWPSWSKTISVPGASHIAVHFTSISLGYNANLYVYNPIYPNAGWNANLNGGVPNLFDIWVHVPGDTAYIYLANLAWTCAMFYL